MRIVAGRIAINGFIASWKEKVAKRGKIAYYYPDLPVWQIGQDGHELRFFEVGYGRRTGKKSC